MVLIEPSGAFTPERKYLHETMIWRHVTDEMEMGRRHLLTTMGAGALAGCTLGQTATTVRIDSLTVANAVPEQWRFDVIITNGDAIHFHQSYTLDAREEGSSALPWVAVEDLPTDPNPYRVTISSDDSSSGEASNSLALHEAISSDHGCVEVTVVNRPNHIDILYSTDCES